MNRSVTAVDGVEAGHWTHESGTTGVTALLFPEGATGAVFVPGSASGGRELAALEARHITGGIHGLCLSGGSAFGLSTADGVMAVLEERGIGFDTGVARVPIVPTAILFDLSVAAMRPGPDEGRRAAEAAHSEPLAEGRVGAGAGARVAKATGNAEPGGTGCWFETLDDDLHVGAVAAVNAVGSVFDPQCGAFVAGSSDRHLAPVSGGTWRGQTTLVALVTDAQLDRGRADVIARMAAAGLARTLFPAFTPFDGDTIFVAATRRGRSVDDPQQLSLLGDRAAWCVERAIVRAITASREAS